MRCTLLALWFAALFVGCNRSQAAVSNTTSTGTPAVFVDDAAANGRREHVTLSGCLRAFDPVAATGPVVADIAAGRLTRFILETPRADDAFSRANRSYELYDVPRNVRDGVNRRVEVSGWIGPASAAPAPSARARVRARPGAAYFPGANAMVTGTIYSPEPFNHPSLGVDTMKIFADRCGY